MRHLYVHVPFCTRRCSYCDFAIAVRKQVPASAYVEAVLGERALLQPWEREPSGLETLYFGGGTPSHLPADALGVLIPALVTAAGARGADLEITLEANPEDVTYSTAQAWRRLGINRISLGVQSFDDRALAWMHRVHTAAQAREAVGILLAAGFENLSLDLIFALPAELGRDWQRDLELALALEPAHLSLYGLTVEPRTPLARWVSRGASSPPDDERYVEEYLLAHAALVGEGFHFYEVSNAARGTCQSRHNRAYWSGDPYVGLGPGAHSFDGEVRRWNLAAWEGYRTALGRNERPVAAEERLTPDLRELEQRYLALRTVEGLPTRAATPSQLLLWKRAGWIRVSDDRFSCTPEGWLRLDALVGDLTGRPGGA